MKSRKIIYVFILVPLLLACTKKKSNNDILFNMDIIKDVSQKKWDKLAEKKIFFGHQSVGYNMIDGLGTILKENPHIKLNIEERSSLSLFDHPVFAHSKNGQNTDPKSKIDAFYKEMEGGLGEKVNIAGFKFCYVDFKSKTKVEEIFGYYKKRMNEISLKYPNVRIIHFTVPLTTIQSGPKAFIKKILGKDIGVEDNYVRQQFNSLLLEEFKGQPIFDLAKHESTYSDGKRESIQVNNKEIYSMIPEYTSDGGHLSKAGRNIIGTQFLLFLIEVSNGR